MLTSNPLSGDAFSSFYGRHVDPMAIWFARRVLDAEVAVDLAAETFAQAYLSRNRFRGRTERQAAGWLYAIARHQLAHYHRKGRAERKAIRRIGLEMPPLAPSEIERIEELAEIDVVRSRLREGLAQITPDQREAIDRRVVDGNSYAEVAILLGVSEQTARSRVSRGLRALEQFLTANPLDEETAR